LRADDQADMRDEVDDELSVLAQRRLDAPPPVSCKTTVSAVRPYSFCGIKK
jgi:hypothetical protein